MVGKTISHYRILDKLGEGGMGVVYKAEDTRLDRTVALKFLSSHLLESEEARERFVHEAKAAATLDHPNICTVHEIDEADGETFLAMAYIEGPTLKQKIDERPLKLRQALDIAIEIAGGLAAAHERGIHHRDIKPANIMLGSDGRVKITDFGLAHLGGRTKITKTGVVLGTPSYMAPEQLRGEQTDRRTDIWSFGVVLHEMITGQPPFEGEKAETLGYAVLHVEPEPLTALRSGVPMDLDRIVAKLLAKDPDERYQHIDEALVDLKALRKQLPETTRTRTTAVPAAAVAKQARLPWMVAALLAVCLVTVTLFWALTPPEPRAVARFEIPLAADQTFSNPGRHIVAVSPDGARIVHTANGDLWLRPLDRLASTRVSGTEDGNAVSPFFSADGQWIGFWNQSDQQLKKLSVTGGAPLTLCATRNPWGASWGADGMILYGQGAEGIWRVPATGGTPEQLIAVEEGELAHGPQMLPGDEWVLFTLRPNGVGDWNQARIVVQSIETGERIGLIEGGRDARYIPTGHLVYALNNVLMAVPFDPGRRRVTPGPAPLVKGVRDAGNATGLAQFAVATNGTLVYVPGESAVSDGIPVRKSRDGQEVEPLADEPLEYPRYLRLSPDGRRLALTTGSGFRGDLWVYDLGGRPPTPITYEDHNLNQVWSPDGTRLAFASDRGGVQNLFSIPADGSTLEPERLLASPNIQTADSWSPDGRELIFEEQRPETGWDILALPLDGEREPRLVVGTEYDEHSPWLSPSGRWLAYVSDVTGQGEIWVREYPGPAAPIRISQNGGLQPVWGRDGRELFYLERETGVGLEDTPLMVVAVDTGAEFRFEPARVLIDRGFLANTAYRYDVAPDGRFVTIQAAEEQGTETARIEVVLNWFEELKRLAPAGD